MALFASLGQLLNGFSRRSAFLRPAAGRARQPRRCPSSAALHVESLETRCLLSTGLVKDIWPGFFSSNPAYLAPLNSTTVLFNANDGVHGTELWRSDGTAPGTYMVKDINPGGIGSAPYGMTAINGVAYFSANDGVHGTELWRSDGTTAGTYMLKDINPGAAGSGPNWLTNVNGELFFIANDGCTGRSFGRAMAPRRVRSWWWTWFQGPPARFSTARPT